MHPLKLFILALLAAGSVVAATVHAATSDTVRLAQSGFGYGDRDPRGYDQPRADSRNSGYGSSRSYSDENRGAWAVGTYHGQNGANGNEKR